MDALGLNEGLSAGVMDIFTFMEKQLDPSVIDRLYSGGDSGPAAGRWACQAVLQALPPLGKLVTMRLLNLPDGVPLAELGSWVQQGHEAELQAAVQKMYALRVLTLGDTAALTAGMAAGLRAALSSRQRSPWQQQDDVAGRHTRAPEKLDEFAQRRWESVLYFLVGSDDEGAAPLPAVVEFVRRTGLMAERPAGEGLVEDAITQRGFQFMLLDVHVQVWMFVLEFIRSGASGADGISPADVLSFLFQLSFCTVGEPYLLERLSEPQQRVMAYLCNFGLMYRKSSSSRRFYATRLAVNLIFGASRLEQAVASSSALGSGAGASAAGGSEADGAAGGSKQQPAPTAAAGARLIVQTNFQVMAYTDSHLHVCTLSMFADVKYRLPNMAVAVITRESVQGALDKGISAALIVRYLHQNAHPWALAARPVVPENVSDQLHLWERERTRVTFEPCTMYGNFDAPELFEATRDYARDLGELLWAGGESSHLVVPAESHKAMKEFIKRRKKELGL